MTILPFFWERIGQEATVQAGYPRPDRFGERQASQKKSAIPVARNHVAYYMK